MKTELRCSREECQESGEPFPHKLWDDERGSYSKKSCPGPGVEVEIPYRDYSYAELADKIDSEGFDYFFSGYASLEEFHDETLKKLVEEYQGAEGRLRDFLNEKGGLL